MEEKRCYGCMKIKSSCPICEHCGYDENMSNASHQLPAGTVLKEQYQVGRVLGQGGFGITYLGWDLYLDIPVAIKEYYPNSAVMRDTSMTLDVVSYSGDVGVRFRNNKERFMREAKMLARFSQVQEIVQVKNFFLANNTAYIVMEYVEGITLKQYVKKQGGKLSIDETYSILRPIMEALCKVHKAGLVHRDISPDNIMMLPDGGAKLLDFGAVRDVGAAAVDKNLTKSTEAILKQGYAPIEQYQSRGSLGPWTDVYALCATMYFCLTGEVPPDAPERLLGEEDLDIRSLVPELSPEHEAILKHGMELRTEKRIPSMIQLCEELFEASSHTSAQKGSDTVKTLDQEAADKVQHLSIEQSQDSEKTTVHDSTTKSTLTAWLNLRTGIIALLAIAAVVLIIVAATGNGSSPAALDESGMSAQSTNGQAGTDQADDTEQTTPDQIISGECGENASWSLNLTTGEMIIEGFGPMDNYYGDWYVGDNTYTDAESLAPWYDYRAEITSVIIGEEITYVSECSFVHCENLRTVHLGNAVESLGLDAFAYTALEEINLPESLRDINGGTFDSTLLRNVTLPESLVNLGASAFYNCPNLTSVTIGENTSLNFDISLTDTTIFPVSSNFTLRGYENTPAEEYARIIGINFESIGTAEWDVNGQCGDDLYWHLDLDTHFLLIDGQGEMWSFNGTWQPEAGDSWDISLTLPPWTEYREQINILCIGDDVTSIGRNAFENCSSLRDLHIGRSLTSIGTEAFLSTAVDELVLPSNVTDIESHAFNFCSQLVYIQLPYQLESLSEGVFNQCLNLETFYVGPDTILIDDTWTPFNHSSEQDMPENMTIYSTPGSDAERFANAHGYEFAVGVMGNAAQDSGQCGDDVYWITCNDTLILYGTGETWIYDVTDEDRASWAEAYYPEEWLHVGHPDFYYTHHDEISRIYIMPGITALNHDLFWDMTSLKIVDLGTVESLIHTFSRCAVTEITLPKTLISLGPASFGGCEQLSRVVIPGDTQIAGDSFLGCTALEEIWFYGEATIDSDDIFGGSRNNNLTFYINKVGSNALIYAKKHGILWEMIIE